MSARSTHSLTCFISYVNFHMYRGARPSSPWRSTLCLQGPHLTNSFLGTTMPCTSTGIFTSKDVFKAQSSSNIDPSRLRHSPSQAFPLIEEQRAAWVDARSHQHAGMCLHPYTPAAQINGVFIIAVGLRLSMLDAGKKKSFRSGSPHADGNQFLCAPSTSLKTPFRDTNRSAEDLAIHLLTLERCCARCWYCS